MVFVQYNNRRRCMLILIICDALVYYNIIIFQTRYLLARTSLEAASGMENNIIIIISRHASTRIVWVRNKRVAAVSRH